MKSYKTFRDDELLFKLAGSYKDIEVLPFENSCLRIPNNWLRLHGYSMRKGKACRKYLQHN